MSVVATLKRHCKSSKISKLATEDNTRKSIALDKNIELVRDIIELSNEFKTVFKVKVVEGEYDVEWITDKSTNKCMHCSKKFNMLTRRRHHCRLCGFIVCNSCSPLLIKIAAFKESKGSKICKICENAEYYEPTVAQRILKLGIHHYFPNAMKIRKSGSLNNSEQASSVYNSIYDLSIFQSESEVGTPCVSPEKSVASASLVDQVERRTSIPFKDDFVESDRKSDDTSVAKSIPKKGILKLDNNRSSISSYSVSVSEKENIVHPFPMIGNDVHRESGSKVLGENSNAFASPYTDASDDEGEGTWQVQYSPVRINIDV